VPYPITTIRREARDRNLPWPAVQDAYRQIKEDEREKRERPNAIRERAWCMAVPVGWHPFWSFGFQSQWGKKVAELDHTVIPGYDEIAQEIGWEFPEYANDTGTERLFDFLLSPYDRMPSAEEMYRRAMDRVEFEITTSEPVETAFEYRSF